MDFNKITNNSVHELKIMMGDCIAKKEYLYKEYKASLYAHEYKWANKLRKRLKSILRKKKAVSLYKKRAVLKIVQLILSSIDKNIETAILLIKSQKLNIEEVLDAWEVAFIKRLCKYYYEDLMTGSKARKNFKVTILGNTLEVEFGFIEYVEDRLLVHEDNTSIKVYYIKDNQQELDTEDTIAEYEYDFKAMLNGVAMLSFKIGVVDSFLEI